MMTSANPSFTWKTPIKFSMAALLALVIDLVGGLYLIGLPFITSRGQTGLWLVALVLIATNAILAGWLASRRKVALAAGIVTGLVLAFVSVPTVIIPALLDGLSHSF